MEYKVNNLYIGNIGTGQKSSSHDSTFDSTPITILYQKKEFPFNHNSLKESLYDVFSDIKYSLDNGNYYYCNSCISDVKSLYSFFTEECLTDKRVQIPNKIVSKILKKKKLFIEELWDLVFYINNAKSSSQKDSLFNDTYNESKGNYDKNMNLKFVSVLTNEKFDTKPTVGRDDEVYNLIITLARKEGNPILVGPSGCGKTAIIDELAYMIQKNNVPDFLKNKKIIELDMTSLLAGARYVGVLEEKVEKLIEYAIKNNAIVFIDEIHTIYGAGASRNNDNDVAGMIKQAIDRKGLKVIGTTTIEEYNKYFSNDALKRRFKKLKIDEPNDDILYQIINKVFFDYGKEYEISIFKNMDYLINTLIELTSKVHRPYNDQVCNPDLVIDIIDSIFADAKIKGQHKLSIDNVIYGIKSSERINASAIKLCLDNLDPTLIDYKLEDHGYQKIIKFPYNKKV